MHTSQFDAGAGAPALLLWLDCGVFTDSKSSKAEGAAVSLMPVPAAPKELYPDASLPDKYSVPCARAEAEEPIGIISARFAASSSAGSNASSNGQHMHKHEKIRDKQPRLSRLPLAPSLLAQQQRYKQRKSCTRKNVPAKLSAATF